MNQAYVAAQEELEACSRRFREKVYINGDGCWLWRARINSWGYGTYYDYDRNRTVLAYRFAWEQQNGPVPQGSVLDHKCCNTECARPAHLRLVTIKQNNEHRTHANKNNTSTEVRGVRFQYGKYRPRVRHNNKLYDGGAYSTLEEAERVVIRMRAELFTHDDGRQI